MMPSLLRKDWLRLTSINWSKISNINFVEDVIAKRFCTSSTLDIEKMTEKINEEKGKVRTESKGRLATLSSVEKTRQSEIVRNKLFANDVYKNAKRISIFLSIDDEIQTLPILKDLFDNGKTVFIPRYSTGKMCAMEMVRLDSWDDYETLPLTRWNIKQPSLDDPRESALDVGGLDLVIMPGLAFTKDGHRLGRGKGHYDRFLNRYVSRHQLKPNTIAIAFKEQIFPHIPMSSTDFHINEVLFEDE